ncbi:hypothetical protein FB451DRAFT_1512625 [Mycena latifolia]|nr:hypothetical protein FB451DRAFT_1512625 [Mycena latifolia]
MAVALAYGSFGDIVDTIKLVVQIAQTIHRGGQMSDKRREVVLELKALFADLDTLRQLALSVPLDASPGQMLFIRRICADVQACRGVLRHFLAKITAPLSVLQMLSAAFSEQRDLAEFRAKIGRHQESLRMWQLMLSLALGLEISNHVQRLGSRVEHVGNHLQGLGRQLSVYHETLPIPRGVIEDMIFVADFIGGTIQIPLRYCYSYGDLRRIVEATFCHTVEFRSASGYMILLPNGQPIIAFDFLGAKDETGWYKKGRITGIR